MRLNAVYKMQLSINKNYLSISMRHTLNQTLKEHLFHVKLITSSLTKCSIVITQNI